MIIDLSKMWSIIFLGHSDQKLYYILDFRFSIKFFLPKHLFFLILKNQTISLLSELRLDGLLVLSRSYGTFLHFTLRILIQEISKQLNFEYEVT
jgi:hypothetical protein